MCDPSREAARVGPDFARPLEPARGTSLDVGDNGSHVGSCQQPASQPAAHLSTFQVCARQDTNKWHRGCAFYRQRAPRTVWGIYRARLWAPRAAPPPWCLPASRALLSQSPPMALLPPSRRQGAGVHRRMPLPSLHSFLHLIQLSGFKNHLYSALCIETDNLPTLPPESPTCNFNSPSDISTWVYIRHRKYKTSKTDTSSPLHPGPISTLVLPSRVRVHPLHLLRQNLGGVTDFSPHIQVTESPVSPTSRKIQNLSTSTVHCDHSNQAPAVSSWTTADVSSLVSLFPLLSAQQPILHRLAKVICVKHKSDKAAPTTKTPGSPPLLQNNMKAASGARGQHKTLNSSSTTDFFLSFPPLFSPDTMVFSVSRTDQPCTHLRAFALRMCSLFGTFPHQSSHGSGLGSSVTIFLMAPPCCWSLMITYFALLSVTQN